MDDNRMTERANEVRSRIREERKKRRWSQEQFSEMLSCPQSAISEWETGRKPLPSADTLLAMAQLFGCDVGYLFGEHDERTKGASTISKATGLSEETVNTLCGLQTWGAGRELAEVVDAIVWDFNHATRGEDIAPLAYLIFWYLKRKHGQLDKAVTLTGEVIDLPSGHLAGALRLNDRVIESAALDGIRDSLKSLKRRLARKER